MLCPLQDAELHIKQLLECAAGGGPARGGARWPLLAAVDLEARRVEAGERGAEDALVSCSAALAPAVSNLHVSRSSRLTVPQLCQAAALWDGFWRVQDERIASHDSAGTSGRSDVAEADTPHLADLALAYFRCCGHSASCAIDLRCAAPYSLYAHELGNPYNTLVQHRRDF